MSVPLKTWSRAAVSMHTHLQQISSRPTPPALPEAAWQACQRQLTLWESAHAKKWSAASQSCRQQLVSALQDLQRQSEHLERELTEPSGSVASAGNIYADLIALRQEFSEVRISLKHQEVLVTTDPLELEGILLGRFEIVLAWKLLPGAAYSVKALEPNPAGGDSETTHPHVQSEKLCEDEGKSAIRAALSAGRLLDFFLIVNQTLATYNSASAYVCLDRWDGTSCCDCECYLHEDDLCHCERCECDLCSECSNYCEACGTYCCAACSTLCRSCGDCSCNSCLKACSSCADYFCKRCLNEEKCKACANKKPVTPEESSAANTTAAAAC